MKRINFILVFLLSVTCVFAEDNILPKWALGGFARPEGVNPLISPTDATSFLCPVKGTPVKWECADTFNPAAVVKDGKIVVLYRAEDDPTAGIGGRTSRVGYAETEDGIHIDNRLKVPVVYPDGSAISNTYEWPGGVEDPRVVEAEIDGKTVYVMTHTSWNKKVARLSIATSTDLKTWTHHGPAFKDALGGKFANLACKSGSIVTEVRDGRLKAARIEIGGKQKYFMYWGESWVCGATSDDLIHWEPIVGDDGELNYLVRPRNGYFDSQLTECGPPAILTQDGIVLIYNGKNKSGANGDPFYAPNTYAAGQMLFSKNDPLKLLDRLDKPFFRPMADFEKSGQYAAGTVFVEGLVYHKDKWFLYYGCADSFVGVAVYDPASTPKTGDPLVLADNIPDGVINQMTSLTSGKMRCHVHSCSGMVNDGESPFYLNASYICQGRKWCDTSTDTPWVVMEFTDIYSINRVAFKDVGEREANCGNVPEYWVYVRVDQSDPWTLVAHEVNVADKAEKDISFPKVEARYVKLVVKRGIRPSGEEDSAIRLYGLDIYGEYSRPATRSDGNVSIGKTILTSFDNASVTGNALNLITGTPLTIAPWRFSKGEPDTSPYRYVVIDLEHMYDIKRFVIWDARSMDENAFNISNYSIMVSEEKPDLSLIGKRGDDNSCWTSVAEKKNASTLNKKVVYLSNPVRARYVKLLIPRTTTSMNNVDSPELFAFHIYGTEADTDGIQNINYNRDADCPKAVCDLQGRRIHDTSYRGIRIEDGRLVVGQ